MVFCHSFFFVTFVVLTVDQFVRCSDGPLEPLMQDSHIFRRTGTFPLTCCNNQSDHCIHIEEIMRIGNGVFDMRWM